MSLIFEALEKAGQEKQEKKEMPSSAGEPVSPGKEKAPPQKNKPLILGIGGALLFLFVLGVLYLGGSALQERGGEKGPLNFSPAPTPLKLKPTSVSSRDRQSLFFLTGITRVGTEWTAIINNQLVRVGDRVSGAIVREIREEEAILDFKDQTITLNLYG